MEMSALPSSMPFADLLARTFNGVINYSRTVPPLSTSTIWLRNSIKLKIVHSRWAEILRIILRINEHLSSGISASKFITIGKRVYVDSTFHRIGKTLQGNSSNQGPEPLRVNTKAQK